MRRRLLNIADILGDRDRAALLALASWKNPRQVVVDLDSAAWKAWAPPGFEPESRKPVKPDPVAAFLKRPAAAIDPNYDPSVVRKGGCCDRPRKLKESE